MYDVISAERRGLSLQSLGSMRLPTVMYPISCGISSRTNLVGGVGFLVDCIRRPHQSRANAHHAAK